MKVLPVQTCHNYVTQKNQNKTSFKASPVERIAANVPIMHTMNDFGNLVNKFLYAVKQEPSLRIINSGLYNEIMQFEGKNAEYLGAFFIRDHNDLFNINTGYIEDVASNSDGSLMSVKVCKDGPCIQFLDSNRGVRFGVTLDNDSYYQFLSTNDVYYDFHNDYRFKGDDGQYHLRQVRTKALGGWDTHWYDRNGNSNVATDIKGFWSDLKSIFK